MISDEQIFEMCANDLGMTEAEKAAYFPDPMKLIHPEWYERV